MNLRTAILAALAAAPCFAQTSDNPPTALEPLVVTATGREIPVRDALAAVIVIPRAEIERAQATDIAELLRFHAGVELGRNGGPGTVTSLFIRGGESNHTLVLVDGVRVNPATSGGAALQNISPEMIERIEIVKGPRATLYGSDAIAGVVNIITRAASGRAAELRTRAGSFGTRDGGAFLAAGDGITGVALHAQHLESDGFPPRPTSAQDRGYRNTTANLRGQTRLAGLRLNAQVWNTQGESEYLGFFGPLDQDFRNQVLSLGAALQPAKSWESSLAISRMEDQVRQNQSTDFVRTVRPAAAWANTLALGGAQYLSFGAQAAREEVSAESFGAPITENRDLYSAYLQYEAAVGPHRALAALSGVDHDTFGSQVTWNAEYGFDLLAGTRLIAATGTGFRAPDATDRFGFGGNPNLEPERARSYEAGVRQELGRHQAAELRLFRSEVEDLISVECVANCADADPFNDVFSAVNVDEYRNNGVELSWHLELNGWSARASVLKQDPRSVARPDPCSGGERLCRRSDESAAASIVRRWGGYQAGFDLLAVGDRVDFAGAPLPGYALLNLTAGLEWARHFRLGARVENLLDREYQTAASFSQAERSFYVTAGWRL
jgi:vitamin B12 transporter